MEGQWDSTEVKVLAPKTDYLSSIPRTHMVDGENQLLPDGLWPPHMNCAILAKYECTDSFRKDLGTVF